MTSGDTQNVPRDTTAPVDEAEIAAQDGFELPDREAMTLLGSGLVGGNLAATPDAGLTGLSTPDAGAANGPIAAATDLGQDQIGDAASSGGSEPYQSSTSSTAQS